MSKMSNDKYLEKVYDSRSWCPITIHLSGAGILHLQFTSILSPSRFLKWSVIPQGFFFCFSETWLASLACIFSLKARLHWRLLPRF